MIDHERYEAACEQGLEKLTTEDPEWFKEIELQYLRMEDAEHCVLGQWQGWFRNGLSALGLDGGHYAADYGFEIFFEDGEGDHSAEAYEFLNNWWYDTVDELQHEAGV